MYEVEFLNFDIDHHNIERRYLLVEDTLQRSALVGVVGSSYIFAEVKVLETKALYLLRLIQVSKCVKVLVDALSDIMYSSQNQCQNCGTLV